MKIFDEMMKSEVRNAFCIKKSLHVGDRDSENNRMTAYIQSRQCENDILRLKNGEYFIAVPKRIQIKKFASDRRRNCYTYPEPDIWLLKLMAFVLMGHDDIFCDSLYSFRKNQNHRAFFKKLRSIDFNRKLYVLKVDVHSYGESVDQDILLDKLESIFMEDPEFYDFLKWFLKRNQYQSDDVIVNSRISIISGTPIGAFFNNVYLAEMDRHLEAESELYMRFADDIAVFTKTYEEVIAAKEYIENFLLEQKLTLNEEKTCIYPPGEPFSILGIRVSEGELDIAPESLRKIFFKIERKQDLLMIKGRKNKIKNSELLKEGVSFINRYFFRTDSEDKDLSWTAWAFGIITTTKTLRLIDNRAQNFLRSIASGKRGDARYRISYDDLKKAGYKSLVHSYHHSANIMK